MFPRFSYLLLLFAWRRPSLLWLKDAINFDAPDFPKKKAYVCQLRFARTAYYRTFLRLMPFLYLSWDFFIYVVGRVFLCKAIT